MLLIIWTLLQAEGHDPRLVRYTVETPSAQACQTLLERIGLAPGQRFNGEPLLEWQCKPKPAKKGDDA